MTISIFAPHRQSILFSLCCLSVAGCASSGPTPGAETEAEPAATGARLYLMDGNGLVRLNEADSAAERLQTAVTFAGLYSLRPGSKDVVITLNSGPGTQLGLLSADGSFRLIHEHPVQAAYTVAWSPEGDLAFGYNSGRGKGIGIFEVDGTVEDVGCAASSRALGWASDDRLVVADDDNRYVVAAGNCKTISRVDSRKLHEVAVNPKRPLIAYVLRELAYDRAARQYVPDSSLHVSRPDGSDPVLVAGDKYRPHRPAWSPDGTELAFDARLPEQTGRRMISVYDVEQASSAFLNPSSLEAPVNEWDARWSPGGSHIAYMQKYGDGFPALVVRPMSGSFTALVGESGERFARWIDDNRLVVTNGAQERLVSIDGTTTFMGPEGATILRVD